MIPKLLDSNFKVIGVLDVFDSFIWKDRYNTYGDFEFVSVPFNEYLSILPTSKYLDLDESEHTMFLEFVNIKTDPKDGNKLILKGRSLESMIDRRIIWDPDIYNGNLQTDFIKHILDVAIIVALPMERRIPGFTWLASTDKYITDLSINEEYYGEIIYDAISEVCKIHDIGFKITLNDSNQFVFNLYVGQDRSSLQTTNPQVVFSRNFDNLINADYIKTDMLLKNVALVAGERGVANTQLTTTSYFGGGDVASGLDRREMFLEATDVKRQSPGTIATDTEYVELLNARGVKELRKKIVIEIIDGEIDTSLFKYGVDFDMGDIVEVQDDYGHSSRSRLVEMVFSQDPSGEAKVPVFAALT